MKILFAIQGTGNGHLSRALEVIPKLKKFGELHLLVSGTDSQIQLPYPVRYKLPGLGFYFGKKGGIDWQQTIKNLQFCKFLNDIRQFPIDKYDVVLNDFEPITAWSARIKGVKAVSYSHQSAYWTPESPRPEQKNPIAEQILRNYAPTNAFVGLHFESYNQFVTTPIIKSELRNQKPTDGNYVTVYLPAYSIDILLNVFEQMPKINFQVFTKHTKKQSSYKNIAIFPVCANAFTSSLVNCSGLICGAGFETPAEALFLGKKLLVIPMRGQYEQACNATALAKIGVTVLQQLNLQSIEILKNWYETKKSIAMHYPDHTAQSLKQAIELATS